MKKLGFESSCLATAIGSLPYTDPAQACRVVTRYLKDVPFWPQLPRRSFLENMYVQFSAGLPGVVVEEAEQRIFVDRSGDLHPELERLYWAYLDNALDSYAIAPQYAAGLQAFLSLRPEGALAVKGHVTGPISFGLAVTDQERRPILYDETLSDAVAKHLRLKAAWQEQKLRQFWPNTIVFVDEPSFGALGSAYVSVPKEQVVKLLEEVLGGISGVKGIHCCDNTDWPVLLGTSIDILSFDAYAYAGSFSLYPQEVKAFVGRGGIVAWGIVPNEEAALLKESVSSLKDRLEEAIAPFTRKGIRFSELIEHSLITPSCGLASLSPEAATSALELLADLSISLRKKYVK